MTARTTDTARAVDALHAIPPDCDRAAWVKTGMAAHAAGLSFDDFDRWSAPAGNYNAQACKSTWRSFKATPGGVSAGALFGMARDHGWRDGDRTARPAPERAKRAAEPPRKPAKGNTAAEILERMEAVKKHAYCDRKQLPDPVLKQLRVVADTDPLKQYRGWLAVPGYDLDGALQTIEFVAPDGQKRTLAGTHKAGAIFTAGPADGPLVVCEGLATAGAVFAST